MIPDGPGFGRIVRTLKHQNFRLYIGGNAVSLIGSWMQRIAVGWLTWELTESGFWLGVVSCADLLPTVLVSPFGGVLADRFNRKRQIMLALAVACCQAFALFVCTALDLMSIELLVLLVLVNGITIGFYQPARLALLSSLLPREDMATGIAINSITFNLARFIGPAIAGLLIVTVGVAAAFAVNTVSFLVFLAVLSRLDIDEGSSDTPTSMRRSVLAELGEGVRYTVRHPGIGPMLLLLLAASVGLRPVLELLPGFAADVFAGGPETLAILSSSIGFGAIISGGLIARRDGRDLTRLVLMANLLLGISILVFVATDFLWLAVISAAFAGMCMVASGVSMQTLVQLSVDGGMRGRVLSLYGIIFTGGPAAGALVMGTLSESFGLRLPLGVGAVLVLLVWFWIWRQRRTISRALDARQATIGTSGTPAPISR